MVQKSILISSVWKVFEVFVDEPLRIHYIKEISRRIKLAPTSVRKHLKELEKQGLIIAKKGERFSGFTANRDNGDFLFFKKMFNLIKLKESGLVDSLINSFYPKTLVLYGSFLKGEDVEGSDVDLLLISKSKKNIDLGEFEDILKRKIHIVVEDSLKKFKDNLKSEIINGMILYGYLENGR